MARVTSPCFLYMNRVKIFIDGSNFYRGMENYFEQEKISINLKQFFFDFENFVKLLGTPSLVETRYYNVRLIRKLNPKRYKSQQKFFAALGKIPNFQVIKGRQVIRDRKSEKCIYCGNNLQFPELVCPYCQNKRSPTYLIEKGVDIRIATDMLIGAFSNEYDHAILISEDGDFVPAITVIRESFKKHVTNAYFPRKQGPTFLHRNCTDYIALTYETYLNPFLKQKTLL